MTLRDSDAHRRVISRRSLLAAAPGLVMLAAGVSCGGAEEDEPTPTSSSGSSTATPATEATATSASGVTTSETDATEAGGGAWSFTDDLGVTIELPAMPERVVAYIPIAASLWDFGVRPVGVYGTTLRADGKREIYTGDVDLDEVVSLGEVYGEIDMEALVALQPDLIVFDVYTSEVDVWGVPAEAIAQIEEIAPILGISFVERPVSETISRIEELAGALGADLEAPEVVEARARFEQASADVEAAVTEKPGLTALFVSGWTDNFYVANAPQWADLIYFQELGLDIVAPDVAPAELWETLSWEQAGKYPADLALNDARSAAFTKEQLSDYATWTSNPAVQAGQVGDWATEFVPSYAGFAVVLEELAETIQQSRADVV